MADLYIIETNNGGDAILTGKDLLLTEGYESMIYIALFGGDDWFGNGLLLENESEQFNSRTGKVLQSVALNSAGRIAIEAAIKDDLEFLKKILTDAKITISTQLESIDRINILILVASSEYYNNITPYTPFMPSSREIFFGQFTLQFTIQFTRSDD